MRSRESEREREVTVRAREQQRQPAQRQRQAPYPDILPVYDTVLLHREPWRHGSLLTTDIYILNEIWVRFLRLF